MLGRTQLVLPFPTPTLSLVTPPEENGEGGIIDGNRCSHIHRGSEIKQVVQEWKEHHRPSQLQRLPAADGSGHRAEPGKQTDLGLQLDSTFSNHKTKEGSIHFLGLHISHL